MKKYMMVRLKDKYNNDKWIATLNQILHEKYKAPKHDPFMHDSLLAEKARYFNTDPEGLQQFRQLARPILPEQLTAASPIWYTPGLLTLRILECQNAGDALCAVAVCKWIQSTRRRYIDSDFCINYQPRMIHHRMDKLLADSGHDLAEVWASLTKK